MAAKLILENNIGIEIAGFVDDDKGVNEEVISGKRILGRLNDLRQLIAEYNIDEIIVAIDGENHETSFCNT